MPSIVLGAGAITVRKTNQKQKSLTPLLSSLSAWRSAAIMKDTVTIQTRKLMTNRLLQWKQMVIDVLQPEKATVPKTNLGKTGQNVQDHTRYHLCIWTQNPFWWWQDNWLWHDLPFLGLCKEEWAQTQACKTCLCEKKKTSRKQQKKHMNRMEKVRGTAKASVGAGKKWAGDWTTEGVKILQWLYLWWLCRFFMKERIN